MSGARVDRAIARIEAALARIQAAGHNRPTRGNDPEAADRVAVLVNTHEKMREEVAETLKDLDKIILELDP